MMGLTIVSDAQTLCTQTKTGAKTLLSKSTIRPQIARPSIQRQIHTICHGWAFVCGRRGLWLLFILSATLQSLGSGWCIVWGPPLRANDSSSSLSFSAWRLSHFGIALGFTAIIAVRPERNEAANFTGERCFQTKTITISRSARLIPCSRKPKYSNLFHKPTGA